MKPIYKSYFGIIYTVPYYTTEFCHNCLEYYGLAIKTNEASLISNKYSPSESVSKKNNNFYNKSKKLYDKLTESYKTTDFTQSSRLTFDKLVKNHFVRVHSYNYGQKVKQSRIFNYKRLKEGLVRVHGIQQQIPGDETTT